MSKHNRNSNTTPAAALAAVAAAQPPEPTLPVAEPVIEEPTNTNTPAEGTVLMTPEQLIAEEAKAAGYESVEAYLEAKKAADATFLKPAKVDRWPDRNRKSTISSPVKMVWHIADAMIGANPDVRRKDVVEACIAQGIAGYTARTQFQAWYTARRESMRAAAEVAQKQAQQKA